MPARKALKGRKIWLLDRNDPCAYCGMPSQSKDHVIPYVALRSGNTEYLVPACLECNRILNDVYTKTFTERRDVLKSRLYSRYRKTLTMPDWDDDDLESLTGTLRQSVEASINLKKIIEQRLEYDCGL